MLFPPLWPIALICAYLNPRGQEPTPPPDLSGLRAALDAATAKVAQIEQRLGKTGAS